MLPYPIIVVFIMLVFMILLPFYETNTTEYDIVDSSIMQEANSEARETALDQDVSEEHAASLLVDS